MPPPSPQILDSPQIFVTAIFFSFSQPIQICIGSTIRIGRESWCLPYAGFFIIFFMVDQRVSGSPTYIMTTGWHHITNLLLVSNNGRKTIIFFVFNILLSSVFGL